MSGGDGSSSTPPTPIASTASPVPPISPFLTPAAAATGIRYPLYVQGLYSPAAIFGQTVLPWRSISTQLSGSASPTTAASSVLPSPSSAAAASPQQTTPTQQLVNMSNLTSITQLPGLVYPLQMPTVLTAQGAVNNIGGTSSSSGVGEAKKLTGPSISGVKRPSDVSGIDAQVDIKRQRLSDGSITPHSPSLTSSSSSHPSTPTQLFKQQPPHSQRSPVIKFIPYTPGQSVLLPSSSAQTTPIVIPQNVGLTQPQAAILAGAAPSPKTTTALAAAIPGATSHVQQQLQHATYTIQHLPSADSASNGGTAIHRLTSGSSAMGGAVPLVGEGGVYGGKTDTVGPAATTNGPSVMSLPYGRRIVLLKCFGPLPDNLSTHSQLVVTNLLVDLYRPSYFTLSNYTEQLALLPESCALLTICYLNSLRSGERISVESLRTMIHYAQLGETDWLHYYKKHKKMSESTFVQSQLMHYSRIAVYPVQGKVRLVVSNQSLSEGITDTLQNLTHILSGSESSKTTIPDYLVVMAIRPLSTIDFCVLVLDPLQVQLLSEMKVLMSHHDTRSRKSHRQPTNGRPHPSSSLPGRMLGRTLTSSANTGTSNHNHSSSKMALPNELQIDRDILFSVQSFRRKLNGEVLLPYASSSSSGAELKTTSELRYCPAGSQWMTVGRSIAESMTPNAPHIIEHRPRGPFQDQYNIAMYMLQRILSSGAKSKIEDFQAIDFRVLCPQDATFISQTTYEIVSSGVISHLTSGLSSSCASSPKDGKFSFTSSAYSEAEKKVVCCSPKYANQFHSFVKEIENNQNTLYVVVAENGHLTTSISHSYSAPVSGSEGTDVSCFSDSQKLLHSFSNCILLYVSSHPYLLQTNRSLVSPSCEIHWPVNAQLSRSDDTGLQFFSSSDCQSSPFKSSLDRSKELVRFCEDDSFEEMFQDALINNFATSASFTEHILALRAKLLLNQYAAAMLVALGQPGRGSRTNGGVPLPETQQLVNHLVLDPVSSHRGHGSMVLIRSHDIKIGKQFYHKLKALRDALGLQFRFEVIFDDGSQLLTVADHFLNRLSKWGAHTPVPARNTSSSPTSLNGSCSGGGSQCNGGMAGEGSNLRHIHSYKELDHLPCVVVLAGGARAGLSFPSSLHFVDLRLCYPTGHVTRTCYEYDTTFFNGYYQSESKTATPAVHRETQQVRETATEAMDTSVACEDSDSEVFEANCSAPPPILNRVSESSHEQASPIDTRINSSSSSSCDDKVSRSSHDRDPSEPMPDRGACQSGRTVEWRPTERCSENDVGHSGGRKRRGGARKTPSDDLQSPPNAVHDASPPHRGTLTVMIDPPNDEEQLFAESAGDDEELHSRFSFRCSSDDNEESVDIFADLDDSDSECEETEGTALTKTCLLSRPYYHIWTSSNPQQNLLLLPAPGVTWYGGHKRPPLFDPDPQQQSVHYRKWTKPLSKEVRGQLDSIIRATNRSSRRSFLLCGPPQIGKTGAWLLMIRLLHSHLHSSQGVTVKNPPPPSSIFVPPTENFRGDMQNDEKPSSQVTALTTTLGSRKSRIVSLECLEKIAKVLNLNTKNDHKQSRKSSTLNSFSKTVAKPTTDLAASSPLSQATTDTPSTISLPLSPYMSYDFAHSCSECSKHTRGNIVAQPDYLSSFLPCTSTSRAAADPQDSVTIKWFIPASQQKYCVMSQDRKTLERLKLPTVKLKGERSAQPMTPIFTPTLGRDSSGLFNLFHCLPHHFHVLVTNVSEFKAYCKAWPHHIVMAFPDQEAGLGSTYHLLKQFVQYNYELNTQSNMTQRMVWPLVAFMSDSIVMWKKLLPGGRTSDVSLSEVMHVMEHGTESFDLVAMSAVPWSKQLEEGSCSTVDELTNYDLSHDFIVLNLAKTSSLNYNQFSLNSAQVGFNLQLHALQTKTKLFKEFAFIHKHLPAGGNPYPTQGRGSSLVGDIDKAVISLHHDSSSHLPYPGAYLMEHFLLYKSQVLFPYAQSPENPVLIVDNYIGLGPHTHVTFIQSMSLTSLDMQNSAVLSYEMDTLSKVHFGGLVLYLCEGKLSSEHLSRLNFVPGACLCLVTRDCKTLVREVARLDLEERWKFRLRDEYQTACSDSMRPLFFLTGRFEG